MAEKMRTGHSITDNTSIKHGARLLSSILAAYDFPDIRRDSDTEDPLDTLLQFYDEDVSESLLTLAAIARACDDELGTLTEMDNNFPNGVGLLKREGKPDIALTIREACNKIIHAKDVRYDLAWSKSCPIWGAWYKSKGYEVDRDFKSPALDLTGSHQNGSGWTARVELIPYIYASSMWDMWKWNIAPNDKESK